jgi:hypothetical protein
MNTDQLLSADQVERIRKWEIGIVQAGTDSATAGEMARLKKNRVKLENIAEMIQAVAKEIVGTKGD